MIHWPNKIYYKLISWTKDSLDKNLLEQLSLGQMFSNWRFPLKENTWDKNTRNCQNIILRHTYLLIYLDEGTNALLALIMVWRWRYLVANFTVLSTLPLLTLLLLLRSGHFYQYDKHKKSKTLTRKKTIIYYEEPNWHNCLISCHLTKCGKS